MKIFYAPQKKSTNKSIQSKKEDRERERTKLSKTRSQQQRSVPNVQYILVGMHGEVNACLMFCASINLGLTIEFCWNF